MPETLFAVWIGRAYEGEPALVGIAPDKETARYCALSQIEYIGGEWAHDGDSQWKRTDEDTRFTNYITITDEDLMESAPSPSTERSE